MTDQEYYEMIDILEQENNDLGKKILNKTREIQKQPLTTLEIVNILKEIYNDGLAEGTQSLQGLLRNQSALQQ